MFEVGPPAPGYRQLLLLSSIQLARGINIREYIQFKAPTNDNGLDYWRNQIDEKLPAVGSALFHRCLSKLRIFVRLKPRSPGPRTEQPGAPDGFPRPDTIPDPVHLARTYAAKVKAAKSVYRSRKPAVNKQEKRVNISAHTVCSTQATHWWQKVDDSHILIRGSW
jgi:hypothetical protein